MLCFALVFHNAAAVYTRSSFLLFQTLFFVADSGWAK